MPLTIELAKEYIDLFAKCTVNADKMAVVDAAINKMLVNRARYEAVAAKLELVPWFFIAVIHNMESSLNFNKHLHNGDALTARTVRVPAGRPQTGTPPFTWEDSAEDALRLKKLDQWRDWSVAGILYQLERYNGFGYRTRHPEVKSPYLWSFSS